MFDLSPEISIYNHIVEYIKESISDRETVEIEYTAFNGGKTNISGGRPQVTI